MSTDIARVVKAYDVRGVVPDDLDAGLARAIGAGFVDIAGDRQGGPDGSAGRAVPVAVVVGHDTRVSSPELAAAVAEGVRGRGVDVVAVGLVSTDELYFASGSLGLPAVMVTASHNPPQYNGLKFCRAGAAPVSADTGLGELADLVAARVAGTAAPVPAGRRGQLIRRDLLADYAAFLHGLVDLSAIRPLRVVVDAGNGMAGLTAPAVLDHPRLEVIPLYFELDGRFPNRSGDPLDPATLADLRAAVRAQHADLGLAFDGDADRCILVDEQGQVVSGSVVTALVGLRELARHPGAVVVHNVVCSRAVPEIIAEHGGAPVRSRVGHSYIKAAMARHQAIFGGEHSGHFYFRDFFGADCGMLAALHVLAALGTAGVPLSALAAGVTRYAASGEINRRVPDVAAATAAVRAAFTGRPGVAFDELDGLTVSHPDWWFSLRPSNTEPLLRLNVEATDPATMAAIRDQVLRLQTPTDATEGTHR